MSKEKDSYTFDESEDDSPIEEFSEIEENKIESQFEEPVDSTIPLIEDEVDEKRKKRKKILIIIFAITLPIVLALTGLGFLIWGLVVGFTTCIDVCSEGCNECFGCCDSCTSCANCCNDCSNSCSNCGSTCDNCNCCSSSGSIIKDGNLSMDKKCTSITLKESIQVSSNLVKWYFYRLYDFMEQLFRKL